jgi:hypothetical protein
VSARAVARRLGQPDGAAAPSGTRAGAAGRKRAGVEEEKGVWGNG